jgi:hypothetical protein
MACYRGVESGVSPGFKAMVMVVDEVKRKWRFRPGSSGSPRTSSTGWLLVSVRDGRVDTGALI